MACLAAEEGQMDFPLLPLSCYCHQPWRKERESDNNLFPTFFRLFQKRDLRGEKIPPPPPERELGLLLLTDQREFFCVLSVLVSLGGGRMP